MNNLFNRAWAGVWGLVFFFCLVSAGGVRAAESSGDAAIKAEVKEQYRQEILGKKGDLKTDKEYVIGYRDILYVEVYGEGSMAIGPSSPAGNTAEFGMKAPGEGQDIVRGRGNGAEVGPDGRVSLRHIGDAYVVGMTIAQCADYLKKVYSAVFTNPTVIVSLVQSNSRQYTMMGQVRTPGLFHLDHPMTVVKAIAKAGGFTEWANHDVTIIRQNAEAATEKGKDASNKTTQQFTFDYDAFLKGKNVEKNIELEPGDVVVIH